MNTVRFLLFWSTYFQFFTYDPQVSLFSFINILLNTTALFSPYIHIASDSKHYEGLSKSVTNGSKTAVIDVLNFLCVH
jgi:hypothetical protein